MLTGHDPERDTAITPSREGEEVMAACPVRLCYRTIALSYSWALTAFWTSSASSNCPSSL
jgi:hypothetical protein